MTRPYAIAKTARDPGHFRLPDPPERDPDEVTQFDHLFKTGNSYHLALHLGNPETTLVEADRWVVLDQSFNKARARVPDLLVAFDVDPEIYAANNGYVASEQGKPPDFIIEVASPSTAAADLNEKRDYYETVGVLEYWLFDRTGEHYGFRLAGFRLGEDGRYHPIVMDVDTADLVQGYSAALNLYLRWEAGELVFYDPATNRPILTYEDQQDRADGAEAELIAQQARADSAEAELTAERARVRELEELLRRQNPDNHNPANPDA